MPRRIGIIGSRRRATGKDYDMALQALFDIYEQGDWLVSGGCHKGGDEFAHRIAKKYGIPIVIFYARWNIWTRILKKIPVLGRLNKKAGHERNTWIADNSDVIIACVSPDGRFEGGTGDTLRKYLQMDKDDIIYI